MIFNIGSGAPSGETLVVTAPAGVTVTASKDNKTKTKIADTNGLVTFNGLTSGTWTVSITDGTQTSSRTIEIITGYSMTIGFFSATITATYPAGSTCTCSDGTTTLTAEDTTGSYTFTVPNAGTWTVTSTDGTSTKTKSVEIITDGQNGSVKLSYAAPLYLVDGINDCTSNWSRSSNVGDLSVTSSGNPTISNSNGTMTVKTTQTESTIWGGSVITSEIDISDYCELRANITATNASDTVGHMFIGIATLIDDGYTIVSKTEKIMAAGAVELDISSLSEGKYIVVIQAIARKGYATTMSFDSIYLE